MSPSIPRERALLAAQAAKTGDWARALELLAFDWRQDDVDAANLAGAALLHLGLAVDAIIALEHAAAAPAPALSDRGACLLNLGRALTLTGQAEAALIRLADAEPLLPPRLPLYLLSQAEALVALGRVDDALGLVPDEVADVALVRARVMLLGAAQRHSAASELLVSAIAAHPGEISLILMASELASVRGRIGEALAMLDKALGINPDHIGLLAQRAILDSRFQISPAGSRPSTWCNFGGGLGSSSCGLCGNV